MLLYIVAGELSGDKHGSLMLRELKSLLPDTEVRGLGGPLMHEEYPEIKDWADEAAVVGFVEVAKNFLFFRRHFIALLHEIKKNKPDVLVLLDYPGFNLRMAEAVKRESPGTKIVYFISPQVWAWHKGRIPKMVRIIDLMLCIFPFEKVLFETAGLPTEFVGHPLVDDINARRNENIRESRLIGLFPGSRSREIERNFPTMLQTALLLKKEHPDWTFETGASSEKFALRLKEICDSLHVPQNLVNIRLGNYHELMDRASAAIIASGTATMEAALHELPYVLIYKMNPFTFWMAKKLVTIKFIGMVNILSGRSIVKELIQDDFTPRKAADEIDRLMSNGYREDILKGMKASVDMLGQGGAARNAAEAIARLVTPESTD